MRVDAMLVPMRTPRRTHRSSRSIGQHCIITGIVGNAWAMADFHFGYGFPIGGVVATDIDNGGVISPGGVGRHQLWCPTVRTQFGIE